MVKLATITLGFALLASPQVDWPQPDDETLLRARQLRLHIDKMLVNLDLKTTEIITIYYGADTKPAEAEQVSASIREQYPQLQIEVVRGDQPYYNYIVSIE